LRGEAEALRGEAMTSRLAEVLKDVVPVGGLIGVVEVLEDVTEALTDVVEAQKDE
jgi:hypothetical protein